MHSELAAPPAPARPLTLPEEIWGTLGQDARATYERAQRVVDLLERRGSMSPAAACGALAVSLQNLVEAVGLLEGMRVVAVAEGPVLHLRAVPDEHVGVVGPDGRRRWIFVCRPVVAPVVDASLLN